MKKLLLFLFLGIKGICFSQNAVGITSINQYGTVKGGIQIDSAFTCKMGDTLNPNIVFPNQRRVGREVTMYGTFRKYVWDGTKYRPYNTFTSALETKLNSVQSGATANQTDAHLLNLTNHTGLLPYAMLSDAPNLNVYMKYSDTVALSDRINLKLSKSDTAGRWKPIGYVPNFSSITSKPTTLNGYGITDAYPLSLNPAGYVKNMDTIGGPGSGAIMTTASANQSLNTKVSKSTTLSINGTSFDLSANRSWTGVGIELPSQTGQSGKVLGTNGTAVSWVTPPTSSYTSGTGINIASNVITNTSPDQVVNLTSGRGISITGTYPNFTISLVTPTIEIKSGGTARALNSNFTVSSTKESFVAYTVSCQVTNPLLVGVSNASAFLEYSTNGGTTWLLPSQQTNSSGVGVTVTVQLTNSQTGVISGYIPANSLVRIRTTTAGTATVTYVTGQETTY